MFFQAWVKQSIHVLHDGNVKNLNSIQHLIVSNFLKLTQVQSRVLYKESSKFTTFTPTYVHACIMKVLKCKTKEIQIKAFEFEV